MAVPSAGAGTRRSPGLEQRAFGRLATQRAQFREHLGVFASEKGEGLARVAREKAD